jgi:hypothetical protein
MPGQRGPVGTRRGVEYASLHEQTHRRHRSAVQHEDGGGDPAEKASHAPLVHAGSSPAPTPASTGAASATITFTTTTSHKPATRAGSRSRPQRSRLPPMVSSSAVPPSAQ